LLLTEEQFIQAAAQNPYPEAVVEPKTLHLFFLSELPINPDLMALTQLKKDTESFELIDQVFYLHAPDGIGRSQLVTKVEKLLGVTTTARTWNTVFKLQNLSNE
jgi:uncharacterized protein (DUF1697 family)